MRSVLLLAVMFLACGTPQATRYNQMAPTAPPAPAFNPVTDSPITTGQPGYVGPVENLPRSPYTRVLPQDEHTRRAPGIWHAVETASTDEHDPIVILGKARLLPVDPNTREILWVSECALGTRNTFAVVASGEGDYEKSQESIKQFGQDGRCIVARFYRTCISNVDNDEMIGRTKIN